MMKNYSFLWVLLCCLWAPASFGQISELVKDPNVVQLSGVVVTGDSLRPVPFSTVYRKNDIQGTVTDLYGFFSLPALSGDTIRFSCVGYMPAEYVIPDTITANRYSVVQILSRDTVQLATTFIYPWPATKEKFKEDFLALDLPLDETERARKNLESIMLYNRMAELGMDGSENYKVAMQKQARQFTYAGQAPPQQIFSPLAWAKFIDAWRNGAFKRQ